MERSHAFAANLAVVRALAARSALQLVAKRGYAKKQPVFAYINNRLEGNAPNTIEAVIAGL